MADCSSRLAASAPAVVTSFDAKRQLRGSIAVSAAAKNDLRHQLDLKLEPFNRTLISRGMKQPSIVDKAGQELLDECTLMEGDQGYECWEAHWKFEDLKEANQEEVEQLVRESSGVSGLIRNLQFRDASGKKKKQQQEQQQQQQDQAAANRMSEMKMKEFAFVEPGSFPKSEQELAEEESALMPDSPFTRLLRRRGIIPKWFSA